MSDLTVTDLLLLKAADAGHLAVRDSRGYDLDNRPEGWPVVVYQDRTVATDDEGRIGSLQSDGYLTDPDSGPIQVTTSGREALR